MKRPPRRIWILFTAQGEIFGTYDSAEEADADAVGPVFRPRHTVRSYALEPKRARAPRVPREDVKR